MVIYKASNKINGKIYIGRTIQELNKRISQHMSKSSDCSYFKNALEKYGVDGFVWEVIDTANSLDDLNDLEYHYIKQYGSYKRDYGYNLTLGGHGVRGFTHSEATKLKISKSKIGVKLPPFSDRHKRRIGKANKGNKHSKASRNKMSKIRTGKYRGEESWRAKYYVVTCPNGKEFKVKSLRNFCKKFFGNYKPYKGLSAVACGKRNQHKGYKCRYYIPEVDYHLSEYTGANYEG
jgi:group I intron endonuclease